MPPEDFKGTVFQKKPNLGSYTGLIIYLNTDKITISSEWDYHPKNFSFNEQKI
jgi:hypothetical protein